MSFFISFLFILFLPAVSLANSELTEVITEISVSSKNTDISLLEKKGIQKGLRLGLIQAAQKLSKQELNSSIRKYYNRTQYPERKGYVHGYSILSKHYDESIGIYRIILKSIYFSSRIRTDILNFGLQQNINEDRSTVFLISARLIDKSTEGIISLSDIISEEFEFSGINGSFLVKGEGAFQKTEKLHNKYHAKLLVIVNLAFTKEKDSENIRGFLSYKVIDKSNKTLKAMSFSEGLKGLNIGEESNEIIYMLTRNLMQKLLRNYSKTMN